MITTISVAITVQLAVLVTSCWYTYPLIFVLLVCVGFMQLRANNIWHVRCNQNFWNGYFES